jgi:hypothetical protein
MSGGVYCCSTAGAGTVGGLGDVTALAAGGSHQCALRSGGGVLCWGDNTNGQIGDRTTVATLRACSLPADRARGSCRAGQRSAS